MNARHKNRFPHVALIFLALLPGLVAATGLQPVDRIVIEKSKRTMVLMSGGKVFKTYLVALGSVPEGRKERMGDHKTPEGHYAIDAKNPHSQYHLALHISYPNRDDKQNARKIGAEPGGAIMIHGIGAKYGWLGSLHRKTDWTDGCVAVTNEEIEEIWRLTPVGTPVEIRP